MAGNRNQVILPKKKMKSKQDIQAMVNRMLRKREETKLFDNTISVSMTSTPTSYALTQNITQGITAGNRIGNIIRLQTLKLSFLQHINSTGTFASTRVIVYRDRENRGAVPAYTDVVTNGGVSALYSPPVIQEKRFIILFDRTFGLNISGNAMVTTRKTIKCDFDVFYNGTASAVTDNGKNSLWLMVWSSDNAHQPGIDGDIELTWTDS